jgi:6,7-dimethyl-8-ribityllumazine synthase
MAQLNNNKNEIPQGIFNQKDALIVIVHTQWNNDIVDALKSSAQENLKINSFNNLQFLKVPGAVEIPFAINNYWQQAIQNNAVLPKAFIAFGCVIKGDTPHFDYVCEAVTYGVMQLNLQLPVPTIFGVLTVNNHQQALDRIKDGSVGDKGKEAAYAALDMIHLKATN